MKSQEKKEIQIILTLNRLEARWLKGFLIELLFKMQNPLSETDDSSIEEPQVAEMRETFWKELNKYDL